MSNILLMVAMHQDVQEKIVNELRAIFPSNQEPVDFDMLNKLTYMETVIKETLRLFPVAAFTLRTTTHDYELDKYTIPAGANIVISTYAVQRNKKNWGDDADIFIPERFETERFKSIHPYAYIPFSSKGFT